MGEEGLLGASRKVGLKSRVERICSLTAVVSLAVLFMHAPEKPMDILTFIVGTQAEALVPLLFLSLTLGLLVPALCQPCSSAHSQNQWAVHMPPLSSSCWMGRIDRSLLKIQVKI